MARSNSGAIVTALTAAALGAVGFLAYQASASAPAIAAKPRPSASAGEHHRQEKPGGAGRTSRHAIPENSGTGLRVVYALGEKRVWLVGADGRAARSYRVTPSKVSPAPGQYTVTGRSALIPGSDGVPVENVVRFASVDGVVVGFSAAVDGSKPDPVSQKKTGGIREERADGKAMWAFAAIGTKVVVVA
ncbi:hypothetical protein [Streptomyces sp. bgisy100]|uniref:hypothetical protein n=1 Tax=Streptomyces sp. bgisy100 TaxID=3413783 RepID=UPI003D75A520